MQQKLASLGLLLVTAISTSACYLGHVTAGQVRLLRARQPVEALLADPATPTELRHGLELVARTRDFARTLGLDVDGQYTSFVPWPGDRIVTTVVATRPGEVEPAGFWFPFLGRLPYKGYFDPERASAEADRLRSRGFDVCVVPVTAYSTLGWFEDPLTGPMLRAGDGRLVETILHELVHATVYLGEDADFDEGVASFVGEEASVRFFAETGPPAAALRRREHVEEGRRVDARIVALRDRVEELYASTPAGDEREAARTRYEAEARADIAALDLATRDADGLASQLALNDACLALAATYASDIPLYAAKLDDLDDDLSAFVGRLRQVAEETDPRQALIGP